MGSNADASGGIHVLLAIIWIPKMGSKYFREGPYSTTKVWSIWTGVQTLRSTMSCRIYMTGLCGTLYLVCQAYKSNCILVVLTIVEGACGWILVCVCILGCVYMLARCFINLFLQAPCVYPMYWVLHILWNIYITFLRSNCRICHSLVGR